jgi:hypothetical protein
VPHAASALPLAYSARLRAQASSLAGKAEHDKAMLDMVELQVGAEAQVAGCRWRQTRGG